MSRFLYKPGIGTDRYHISFRSHHLRTQGYFIYYYSWYLSVPFMANRGDLSRFLYKPGIGTDRYHISFRAHHMVPISTFLG